MFIKSGKLYDITKWIALVGLPGAGTLYVALGAIWSFDNTQSILGTILAVDTFLGGLIHLSSASYKASDAAYDGTVDVVSTPTGKTFSLSVNSDLDTLDQKKNLTLKVNPANTPVPLQPSPNTGN